MMELAFRPLLIIPISTLPRPSVPLRPLKTGSETGYLLPIQSFLKSNTAIKGPKTPKAPPYYPPDESSYSYYPTGHLLPLLIVHGRHNNNSFRGRHIAYRYYREQPAAPTHINTTSYPNSSY